MTFFYDLNKRLADLAAKQDQQQLAESKKVEAVAQSPLTQALNESAVAEAGYSAKKAAAGKDIGKPGKNFAKIEKSAAKRYGSKEAGARVAGAVLNKLRTKEDVAQEGNAFSGAVAKAKADGIQKGEKIKVGGKTYPVTEEEMDESVSRKHFQQIADTLRHIEDMNKRRELAQHHASAFKLANPRFDQHKFFKAAGLDEADMTGLEEGYAEMDAWLKQREKEKGTGKFDKKKISTGTVYTRRLDDEPEDDEADTGAPKKKGRPAGTKRAIGAKGPGVNSKLLQKGAIKETEGCVCEMCGQPIEEKAVSKKQQKFMGMVHAAQKGEKPASKEVAKVAKTMKKSDAEDFAATKHKGLPEKVKAKKTEGAKPDFLDMDKDGDKKEPMKKAAADKKEKKVDETTTSGSVATAPAKAASSTGGMQFGKGVYEGFNNTVEQMITEGMNITVNLNKGADGEPTRSITVTADGADADNLAQLLKMAGLESTAESTCQSCGHSPCECDHALEENQPDWPTNTETSGDALQYSGGINGPKSTGQTTVPVVASQSSRQRTSTMEESVELERSLFKTWKNYKG